MTPDIRTRIDIYLDAVDLALLKSGASRNRRGGIVRDLESHILDVLREKAAGREETPVDVAEVLAGLDAPEAYGAGVEPHVMSRAVRRSLPSGIRWGAALLAMGLLGLMILAESVGSRIHDASEFLVLILAATPMVLMIAMSSFLGFAGYRKIRRNPEKFWGRVFAVVEMAAFPFLIILASPMLFLTVLFTSVLLFAFNRVYGLRGAASRFLDYS